MASNGVPPPRAGHDDDELPKKKTWPMNEDIVISGISGRYPESDSLDEFWSNLMSGVELVTADDRRWPVGK